MSKTTIAGTYIGRRQLEKGGLGHLWKFGDEQKPRVYKTSIAPAAIGEVWQFTETEAGIITAGTDRPKQCAAFANSESIKEWNALDVAHYQEHKYAQTMKKLAKRQTAFDAVISPLKAMANSLPSHSERAAFIQHVVSELWRRS